MSEDPKITIAAALDTIADVIGELDGEPISDELHRSAAEIAAALAELDDRVSKADVVRVLARELDVEVDLDNAPTARAVLDEGEREALVEDVADALGVRHSGASALDVGILSIDPTEIPPILFDREALAAGFRAFEAVTRAMADRFAAAAAALDSAEESRP